MTKAIGRAADIGAFSRDSGDTADDAARFRDFAEAVSDWLWETDADDRFTFVSGRFFEVTGYTPEQVLGKLRAEIDFEPVDQEAADAFREAREQGKPFRNLLFVGNPPNGRRMWVRIGGNPVFGADGRLTGYRGATSDISELYEMQAWLAESEQRLSDFAQATGDWFWEMGPDLRFNFVSANIADYMDRTPSWYIGRNRAEVADADNDPEAMARHLEDLENHRPFRDFRYFKSDGDGRRQWFSISGKPVFDRDGNFCGYRGVGSDVTELYETERQLRRFAAVIDATNEAFIAVDTNAVITDWNPAAERLYGYSAEEAVGQPMSILTGDEEQARHQRELVERALAGEAVMGIEGQRTTKDGQAVHLLLSLSPLRDPQGGVTGLCGVAMDITERKQAEEQLRERRDQLRQRKEQLRLVTDAIPALICYVDRDFTYRLINRTGCEWYGMPPEEIVGKTSHELVGADLVERLRPYVDRVFAGETVTYEDERTYPDGEFRAIETTYIPQLDENGEVEGFYTLATDITERRRAAEQAAEQHQRLVELNQQKDRLFSIIAHDLKSPMSAIVGFGAILAERADLLEPAKIGEYAGLMQQAADQASLVLKDLMDWARSQDGRALFEPDAVDVSELVEHSFRIAAAQAKAKDIELEFSDSTRASAWADPHMSHTIMRNLLDNAIKFTPEGGRIAVATRLKDDWVEISVTDTGVGMSQKRIDRLFRLDGTESTEGTQGEKGTGLGLHLCKSLVERHGGKIWADSVEGEGTTFTFQLPPVRGAY